MKKSLLQLLSTSFILISLHSFAGTSPASSTGKGRSNSLRNAHHIVGGNGFAVEIRSGEIWSWGANDKGQLGTGNNTPSSVPVQEATHSTNWVDINAGSGHVMAVKSDGTLWVWGLNDKGQLGIGNQTDQNIPVQIGTERDWVSLGCGSSQSFAIKANGSMWVCGSNQSGALGLNILQTIFNQLSLTQLGNSLNWKFVSGSDNFVAALQADGTVYT